DRAAQHHIDLLLTIARVVVLGVAGAVGVELHHIHAPGRDAEGTAGGTKTDAGNGAGSVVGWDFFDGLHGDVLHRYAPLAGYLWARVGRQGLYKRDRPGMAALVAWSPVAKAGAASKPTPTAQRLRSATWWPPTGAGAGIYGGRRPTRRSS